jgi:hypothetical protein
MALDKRIGTKHADYSINTWPELSINGRAYERPCRTVGIGPGHFVVIDSFPLPGWRDEVETLRKAIQGMGAAPKGKGVKNVPERSGETG